MSRRSQIQLTPDEQAAFLSEPHKAALATLDKDGFPHVVAMSFLARDGAIYMTSYAKAQKVLNIRRDPRVGVMIETGRQYSEFRAVMIRGHCEVVEDAGARRVHHPGRRGEAGGARSDPERGDDERAEARRAQDRAREDRELGSHQARRPVLTSTGGR